jgi:hypothetical protein
MSEQALATGTAVQRRLSDLIPPPGTAGPDVFLADRDAAQAAIAEGTDPVLYCAWRNVLPPRAGTAQPEHRGAGGRSAGAGPGGLAWLADLVVYQDGTLPGGEPFRSTGHWNPDGQLEVFQVISGRVLIVTAGTSATGRGYVQYQECGAGDLAVVPLAAWHLTYALDGPAMVFNIYTSQGSGSQAATGVSKYRSGRGPVPVAALRKGRSFAFTWGATESAGLGEPAAASCPEWLMSFLPPGASLADWCVRAPAGELSELAQAAQAAAGPAGRREARGKWQ